MIMDILQLIGGIETGAYDPSASDHFFDILKSLKEQGADMDARDYGDVQFSTATLETGSWINVDKQERYHGLDFIRAMAMMLGLSVHVNIFYFSEDRMFWNAGEYHGDPINQFIAFFIFQFRMPLFYMLAGFFALLVIERKGLGFITWDRVKRIGYRL